MSWRNPNKRDRTGRMLRYSSPVDAGLVDLASVYRVQMANGAAVDIGPFSRSVTLSTGSIVDTEPPPIGGESWLKGATTDTLLVGDSGMGQYLADLDSWFIGGWVRVSSFGSNYINVAHRRVSGSGSVSDREFDFFAKTTGIELYIGTGSTLRTIFDITNQSMATGTWYHLAFARLGNFIRAYRAGVQIGEYDNTSAFGWSTINKPAVGHRWGYDSAGASFAGLSRYADLRYRSDMPAAWWGGFDPETI